MKVMVTTSNFGGKLNTSVPNKAQAKREKRGPHISYRFSLKKTLPWEKPYGGCWMTDYDLGAEANFYSEDSILNY
ncbi:hypothetical protein V2J09_018654 [Rumex salicifolius]